MIVDKINSYLASTGRPIDQAILEEVCALAKSAFVKQFGVREERTNKTPYFSSIGKCLRQQAYEILGFQANGKELDARSKMVFFMGDLAEIAVVQLAKQAGCNITVSGMGQTSMEWNGMRGRPDGVLDGKFLVEVKSMASYSFERFERGEVDEGYLYQCNSGMEALKLDGTVIVALNKDAGVLAEKVITKDMVIVTDIKARLATLKSATRDNLPPRPHAPNEKGFYPWQCLYCAHWKTCLPGAEKVLVSRSYKLKAGKGDLHAAA